MSLSVQTQVRPSTSIRFHQKRYRFINQKTKHNDCIASTRPFRIVIISFSAVYTKTMKTIKRIENRKNQRKSTVCVSR